MIIAKIDSEIQKKGLLLPVKYRTIEDVWKRGLPVKLVTNNPLVKTKYENDFTVDFTETDLIGILIRARDLIHKGHKLLTHPLSGSVKPNETIYKTIMISETPGETDMQSVVIIEDCIIAAEKFTQRQLPEQFIYDMQVVDLSLIESAVKSALGSAGKL